MPDDHRSIVRRGLQPQSASRPVVNPISPSVVYASPDADALDAQYEGRVKGYTYGREGHPNWSILADKLDWLEGARGGVVMASGMAAVGAVFKAVVRSGDHVVAGNQLYGRTLRMLRDEMPRIGVEVTLADPTDGRAFAAAIREGTRLVLAERGLHSFDIRFERAQANAAALADHLAGLAGVEAVLYPGRADHPDHNRAVALLGGQGGNMVSFRLKGGRAEVNRFLRAATHIPFAPTLGDIGTTLSHPASSSHRGLTPEGRAALGITEGFIRVSVGIEDIGLLTREFSAAVAAAKG